MERKLRLIRGERPRESFEKEATHILEEARMILPGIQALFGFQLICVFQDRFYTHLSNFDQSLHVCAILLVVISIGLLMAPAAYHRQAEAGRISQFFLHLSSRYLTIGMFPLALAISIDVFIVVKTVFAGSALATVLSLLMFLTLLGLWFFQPRWGNYVRSKNLFGKS